MSAINSGIGSTAPDFQIDQANDVSVAISDPFNMFVKRMIDVLGATAALIVLAPVFLLVAALVKLSDPAGPVFYKQSRIGRGNRNIGVLKFRSMKWEYSTGPQRPYKTATQAFEAMGRSDLCAEFEETQKVSNDPRVSRFGHLLRRTSLDELPQLLNALLGHVSLVGPRPIISQELERYGVEQSTYLSVKPGITGLWQVSGRSETGYDERVRLDVEYVRTWRLTLDLYILLRTVHTVVAQRGAY